MPRLKSYYININQIDLIDKNLIKMPSCVFTLKVNNPMLSLLSFKKNDTFFSKLFLENFFTQNYYNLKFTLNLRKNFFFNFVDIFFVSTFLNFYCTNYFLKSFFFFKDFVFKKIFFRDKNLGLHIDLPCEIGWNYNIFSTFFIQ